MVALGSLTYVGTKLEDKLWQTVVDGYAIVLTKEYGRVLMIHGGEHGSLLDVPEEALHSLHFDAILCCYPKQVSALHPEYHILFNHIDQPIEVQHDASWTSIILSTAQGG